MNPVCSVVIATHNRCVSLRSALDCVLHQSLEAPYEVIVVDNASTDATATVVADYQRRHSYLRYVADSIRNTGTPKTRSYSRG